MSKPGGGAPAGRRSPLGDADRERLLAQLREHYAAGRLDLDDLRHRVGVVLAAANAEQATAALADLPPAGVPETPGTGRRRGSRGRHAQTSEPGPGWIPTAERFRDPSGGVIMRVWIDPSDESRHYVPDDSPATIVLTEVGDLADAGEEPPAAAPGVDALSPRERELVTLVARGRTDAQIAEQLHISVRTVGSHLDRIRDKTGCRRRADLTRLALNAGLV
ncbi:MAG TPA: LuxR C-terminal-related transcriptional regulator [Streptosporangiaceae bacterium]|jgi:DNA-binding CsgD family transcriptional regulator